MAGHVRTGFSNSAPQSHLRAQAAGVAGGAPLRPAPKREKNLSAPSDTIPGVTFCIGGLPEEIAPMKTDPSRLQSFKPSCCSWVPPEGLQRIQVPRAEGNSAYTLFFPMELTSKDYLRRIFDIVASGIQGTVMRKIAQYRSSGTPLKPIGAKKGKHVTQPKSYDFANTCDIYYLSKHIEENSQIYARGLHCGL
jgi:hypothetical protein